MRRQAATILALSTIPDYLFFDETFDGLDPVMRRLVKQVIYNDVLDRGTTTIITSHSLRELEDTCDQLALLHKGGIVFESDIQNLKTALFKVQVAFASPFTKEKFASAGINIISYNQVGSVATFIVRGDREETETCLRHMNPLLLDMLSLNLEEVFIYEMEALGYAFKDILM
jgi:ABC-2 type transport system ATP-binding protein